MTTKRIAWTDPGSGDVHLVVPADAEQLPGESEADFLARIQAKDVPEGVAAIVLEAVAFTIFMRRWRKAWALSEGAVVIPLPRARLLRLKELITLKIARLKELTDQIEQAVDNGNTILAASLRAKRKAARDVDLVAALQAITDLAVLDTFVPTELQ